MNDQQCNDEEMQERVECQHPDSKCYVMMPSALDLLWGKSESVDFHTGRIGTNFLL